MRRATLARALLGVALAAARAHGQDPGPPPVSASSRANPVVTSLTLFAGTAEGLWRSEDWGGSWTRIASAPPGGGLEALGTAHAVLPVGPHVFAAGDGGLFQSEDFGLTWKRLFDGSAAASVLPSRYPQSDPTVFLGTPSGLLRSADAGRSFGPTALGDAAVLRLEWPGPALVVATSAGVVVSEDAARSFRDRGVGLPEGEVRALAVSSFFAADPVLFAGGDFGVYRSRDAGRTWTKTALADRPVHDLVWLGPFLYAAGDFGVMRSEDTGASWVVLSKGLGRAQGRRLMFPLAPAAGLEAFLGTDDGVFKTIDAGQTWTRAGLEGRPILVLATFPAPDPILGKRRK